MVEKNRKIILISISVSTLALGFLPFYCVDMFTLTGIKEQPDILVFHYHRSFFIIKELLSLTPADEIHYIVLTIYLLEIFSSVLLIASAILLFISAFKKNKVLVITSISCLFIILVNYLVITGLYEKFLLHAGFYLTLLIALLPLFYFALNLYFAKHPTPRVKTVKPPKPKKLSKTQRIARLEREVEELKASREDDA